MPPFHKLRIDMAYEFLKIIWKREVQAILKNDAKYLIQGDETMEDWTKLPEKERFERMLKTIYEKPVDDSSQADHSQQKKKKPKKQKKEKLDKDQEEMKCRRSFIEDFGLDAEFFYDYILDRFIRARNKQMAKFGEDIGFGADYVRESYPINQVHVFRPIPENAFTKRKARTQKSSSSASVLASGPSAICSDSDQSPLPTVGIRQSRRLIEKRRAHTVGESIDELSSQKKQKKSK